MTGGVHRVGAPSQAGRSNLVFFLSPTCPVCKELLPALRSLAQAERAWLDVLLASDGPRAEHERLVADHRLSEFPYLLSTDLGMTYKVSKLPYAVLIDGKGILRAHGLVNSREHLESLLEAMERRVASLQDYLAQETAEGERMRAS